MNRVYKNHVTLSQINSKNTFLTHTCLNNKYAGTKELCIILLMMNWYQGIVVGDESACTVPQY